jgi:predicted metal-dependent hydrolase
MNGLLMFIVNILLYFQCCKKIHRGYIVLEVKVHLMIIFGFTKQQRRRWLSPHRDAILQHIDTTQLNGVKRIYVAQFSMKHFGIQYFELKVHKNAHQSQPCKTMTSHIITYVPEQHAPVKITNQYRFCVLILLLVKKM